MNSKEKAKELINKFYDEVKYMERAKQCALITADEAIKVAYWPTARQYWKEVKKELEDFTTNTI